jgi:hypothetical protein
MTPTHDQFTLLYEDEHTKLLYEFKALVADDVINHLVDFLKGCGYMESSIFESMQEYAEMYFDSLRVTNSVMSTENCSFNKTSFL